MKKIISLYPLRFFLFASIVLNTSKLFSQEKEPDTLKIKWKNSRIWIFDAEDIVKDTSKREGKKNKKDFTHWGGFDLGFCMLTTAENQFRVPQEENIYNTNYFLDLKYERSYYVSLNLIEKSVKLYKNHIHFISGFGVEWNAYNFRNKITLSPDSAINSFTVSLDTNSAVRYIKNQLKLACIKIPFLLEFNTHSTNPKKSFHFAGGLELAYKIDSWTKQKMEHNNYIYKVKRHDDYNLNPLKYGLTVRVGYGELTLFVNYAYSTLFEKDKGPEKPVYPVSAGFALAF